MIENKLRPDIDKLNLISMEVDTTSMTPATKTYFIENIKTYPMVMYYNLVIPLNDIKSMNIDFTGFIPTFYINFVDNTNLMVDKGFPTDNSIISVYLPSNSNNLKSIRLDFIITVFDINSDYDSRSMHITGILNINSMFINEYKSYKKSSSYNCLYKVAEQTGIGFNTNIDNTNDIMTWINPGLDIFEFIKHVTKHSYLTDNSFMFSFIDNFYNLTFIDIEKALEEDISEKQGVVTSSVYGATKNDNQITSNIILTNDVNVQNTNLYFDKYKILNQSSKISLTEGYIKHAYYFDRRGNWENKAGSFYIFGIDSITTPGSEKTSVILKSTPNDLEFYKKNNSFTYAGKIDTDNVHKEYAYAEVQNSHNLTQLQKVSIEVNLPTPNFNIHRFQKINIVIANKFYIDGRGTINERMAGQWLVTGIIYKYNIKNKLTQQLTLVKRELNVEDLTK
jgi:hypothetical protein